MYINFQLGAEALLSVIRNELRKTLHICVEPFEIGGLGTVYLDHIEVPTASGFPDSQMAFAAGFVRRSPDQSENTIAHGWTPLFGDPVIEFDDVMVNDPEIVVPLRLHVTTDAMIQNADDAITSDGLVVRLVFVVHADMLRNEFDQDGNPKPWAPNVSISVVDVDFGLLADQIPPADQQQIRAKVLGKSVPLPVSLQPIKVLLKNKIPLAVFNVGVSIDVPHDGPGHATQLALRWEVNGPADSLNTWAGFFDGAIGPGLTAAKGCQLSMPSGLLTAWSVAMFTERLETESSKPNAGFSVDAWPTASWFPWEMLTTFDFEVAVPVCPDIGVTVDVATTFSLGDGELIAVSTITHDANDWDVFVCTSLQGPPSKLFDTVVGAIVADVYQPGLANKVGKLPSGCEWTQEDKEITCTFPLSLPFGDIAATIDQVLPMLDGLLLSGVVDVDETKASSPWFNPHPKLGWIEPTLCEDFVPRVELKLASVFPGTICAFSVQDDPVQQFTPYVYSSGHELWLRLQLGSLVGGTEPLVIPGAPGKPQFPDGSYFKNPYPLKVLVRTTDGIKLVVSENSLPLPPKAPTLTPLQAIELAATKKLNCQTWAVWQPEQIFRFRWTPDPPWDKVFPGAINEHLWRVLISDSEPGREVIAQTGTATVATGWVGARGFARFDLLFAETTNEDLLLSRATSGAIETARLGAIHVRQQLLVPTAKAPLMARCEEITLSAFSPEIAWCFTSAGVLAYRIDIPGAPTIVQRIDVPELRGIIPLSRDRLVTWGLDGIFLRRWNERRSTVRVTSDQVIDVARDEHTLFALTTDGVVEYEDWERKGRSWPRSGGAMFIGCTTQAVIVGSGAGLAVYDRRGTDTSRITAEIPVTDAIAIAPGTGPWREHELVVRLRDGSSLLLDLSEPAKPQTIAHIQSDRWSRVRRLGKTVARASEDGIALEVFRLERELALNKIQIEGAAIARGAAPLI